jgi:hypothetical protein
VKIEELDEYQGLTVDLFEQWLVRSGWERCHKSLGRERWQKSDGRMVYQLNAEDIPRSLALLSSWQKLSVQDLLRQANPRLRDGLPSRAALEAHGETGDWLASRRSLHTVRFVWSVNDYIQMIDGFDVFSTENRADEQMMQETSFWPCDAAGNKVRWPERDGVML